VPQSQFAPHASTPAELVARQDAARAGAPYLVLRDGDGRQIVAPLDAARGRVTIGRRAETDIPLPWDERVSRLHAELEVSGGEWVVSDDGLSTNGTWVGETRLVGRRRLRDGDVIRVGGTLIGFCAPAASIPSTALGGEDDGTAVRVSPAQRRVLVALCRPLLTGSYGPPPGNAQLADELFLSVNSVKTHVKALVSAFGLDGVPQSEKRAALVARATQLGIVTERDIT
jgi:pSer/pThr/pTyr-binding forkhead associated (FHA) protein